MKLCLLACLIFSLTACGGSDEVLYEADAVDVTPAGDSSETPPASLNRLYLKNVSESDFEPYLVEHEGEDRLVICHVPVGNPVNFKTHMVSPESLQAHMNHGSKNSKKTLGVSHGHHGKRSNSGKDSNKGKKCDDDEDTKSDASDTDSDEEESHWADVYVGDDYIGACGKPEPLDDIIVLDDPVFPEDGIVCEGLTGPALYDCLAEHQQSIAYDL